MNRKKMRKAKTTGKSSRIVEVLRGLEVSGGYNRLVQLSQESTASQRHVAVCVQWGQRKTSAGRCRRRPQRAAGFRGLRGRDGCWAAHAEMLVGCLWEIKNHRCAIIAAAADNYFPDFLERLPAISSCRCAAAPARWRLMMKNQPQTSSIQ